MRLTAPLVLRQYLLWLSSTQKRNERPLWEGPLLALGMGACAVCLALIQHQQPWFGTLLGWIMRQQVTTAAHEKLLRLNATCVTAVSPGFIINLLSNDVRRFDDAAFYWFFTFAAPLELAMVYVMVSLDLDPLSALAGVSATFLLVPLQAALVRPVASIRRDTAVRTDQRARLSSEAIQGALACKMLGWEDPLTQQLRTLRQAEARDGLSRMAVIRATNMATQFFITVLVTFSTFAVYHARNGTLRVASVFYALSLLQLPRRSMSSFVSAIQALTELRVSLQRFQRFLDTPEPPQPGAALAGASGEIPVPVGTVALTGSDYDWRHPFGIAGLRQEYASGALDGAGQLAGLPLPGSPASGSCGGARSLTLEGVTFLLRPGELLGVCGDVGAGKTSLLAALLGELQPLSQAIPGPAQQSHHELAQLQALAKGGPVIVGPVAYCAQIPWIMAGTVRQNVTFNAEWDAALYKQVLWACALETDVAELPAGDLTELGDRGINLSGGQKARVALARAAFSRPAVALLDDPLSAVDPRVGRALFSRCIGPGGLLQSATRVLVTHQQQYLPRCDRVLVLREGRVVALGPWDDLQRLGLPELAKHGRDDGQTQTLIDGSDEEEEKFVNGEGRIVSVEDLGALTASGSGGRPDTPPTASLQGCQDSRGSPPASRANSSDVLADAKDAKMIAVAMGSGQLSASGVQLAGSVPPAAKASGNAEAAPPAEGPPEQTVTAPGGTLVEAEGRVIGRVGWTVYTRYAATIGTGPCVAIALTVLSGQAAYLASDWWLAMWSRSDPNRQTENRWLWVYGMLAALVVTLGLIRAFLFFAASLRAATAMHDAMVGRLLRAPLSFFHTNPPGRVLNRLSKDQGSVDEQLPVVMFDALQCGLLVLGALVLATAAVPQVLPIFLPLGVAFHVIRLRYLGASREVKRWDSVTRSPVFATFSSSLKGLSTIRAYGAQERFHAALLSLATANGAWNFAFNACGRWIGFRLDLISATVLASAGLVAAAARHSVSPALLGLALSHLMTMMGIMQWFIRQSAEVENNMTCAERILEYTRLPCEPPRVAEGGRAPPPGWPATADLSFTAVSARYRPGLPPVLQDLTFHLKAGTVCGVVGRTGSGKSSLALALFRLIEVVAGRVELGGLDVAGIGLDALRSQLAIIPQDPVLFSGTVRSNLDPWNRYTDAALWDVLRRVQLARAVTGMGAGLASRMAEGGDNLSAGQRQLFCLARALLQRASVLVLDEATANVDRETDALIHGALAGYVRPPQGGDKAGSIHDSHNNGELFSGSVLLVIAHRLDTIMGADHLLVLGGGRLLEQGPPKELALREGGAFAGMAQAAQAVAREGR